MSGNHIVVTGAICKCSFGKNPSILTILTNTSVHANDTNGPPKFMATTADIGNPFMLPTFGACSNQFNIPCIIMITNWQDYSEKIMLDGGNALLEKSSATCAFGTPGCITVIHHGQIQEMSLGQFENGDPEVTKILNPAVDLRDIQDDPGVPDGIEIS